MVTLTLEIGDRKITATGETPKECADAIDFLVKAGNPPLVKSIRDQFRALNQRINEEQKRDGFGLGLHLQSDLIRLSVPPLADYVFKVDSFYASDVLKQLNLYLKTIEQNAVERCAKIAEEWDDKAIAEDIRKKAQ